ncbi:MAG: type IV secretory system conjugative DNA transfer family protein [Roseburia hominis]
MTSQSDWTLDDIDDKKVITYIILPDEKTTYHPIGALLLKQIYEKLVEIAIRKGGELDRRFIFRTEEIGNFPKIPDLGTMLSAGAGRNIFFELVIQDYQQTRA